MNHGPGISLDTSMLSRAQRRRLDRLAARSSTLAELRKRCRPEDLGALEECIRRSLSLAPSTSSAPSPGARKLAGPFPGWSDPALAMAWIRARCRSNVMQTPLWHIFGGGAIRHSRRIDVYDETIGDFLDEGVERDSPLAERLGTWLDRHAADLGRARSLHEEQEVWRAVPPDPPLRELWTTLRSLQESLLTEAGGPMVPEDVTEVELLQDPLTLAVPSCIEVELEAVDEDDRIRIGYYLEDCLTGVGLLLDVLTHPSGSEMREALRTTLTQSKAMRSLSRLVARSTPTPLDPEDDKRLLGWEWLDGDVEPALLPVQCRPARRGDTFVTRRISRPDPHSELFADPRDRHLLGLSGAHDDGALVRGLRRLRGHPRVFSAAHSRKRALRVREARLALSLSSTAGPEGGATLRVTLDGAPLILDWRSMHPPGLVVQTTDKELVFAEVAPAMRPWLQRLSAGALTFSTEAELAALRESLPTLSAHLPLDVDEAFMGRPIVGDTRPQIRCRWSSGALDVQVRVAPLVDAAAYPPGEGPSILFVERDGRMRSCRRQLRGEVGRVREALAALSGLDLDPSSETQPFDWSFDDPQDALSVLAALRAHRESVQLRWEGDPPRAPGSASLRSLRLAVGSGTDWFGLSGRVGEGPDSVALKTAMTAAAAGHTFVSLGKDRWLALEESLRTQLAGLASIEEKGRIGALHGAVIDELETLGAQVEASTGWRARREAAAAAPNLAVEVPDGLEATLRPYQEEGFRWLARLASWAPGACLADDMGLGKTIQSIALLLHRRDTGPALVVAPTSVVDNWAAECARFAPGLRVDAYRGPGREALLQDPPDVLLTSYALLARDAEALRGVRWGTVVLDEAQAIRNPEAKRARGAHSLDADFRLALSGTPVQNRTSELWSLMAFATPGLLGTHAHFQRTFARPIEAQEDVDQRALLARLISPFVLRRTKGVVAKELPERTEQLIRVELSAEEAAHYEAERQASVQRLRAAGRQRGFRMLQELTRLRQIACHPRMVDASSEIRSSKLKAVVSTLVQLRAAGNKALVFSSFTTHLGLVRHALEERAFKVRYLDGSTSVARRAEEIEAFQAGDGDVFLLSLKAGGTGLNLTRATYVLHLDPWWNPAAEDQASDRAHRIGQTDPVTVYRFIGAGTIEEQIVALHAKKRDLATALLSASDSTTIPDTEALMALLEASRSGPGDAPFPVVQASAPAVTEADRAMTQQPETALPVEPAPAADVASLDVKVVIAAFEEHLRRDLTAGSAKAYAGCAKHALRHAIDHGEVLPGLHAYQDLAAEGRGRTRTCTRLARVTVPRLAAWWKDEGAERFGRP